MYFGGNLLKLKAETLDVGSSFGCIFIVNKKSGNAEYFKYAFYKTSKKFA